MQAKRAPDLPRPGPRFVLTSAVFPPRPQQMLVRGAKRSTLTQRVPGWRRVDPLPSLPNTLMRRRAWQRLLGAGGTGCSVQVSFEAGGCGSDGACLNSWSVPRRSGSACTLGCTSHKSTPGLGHRGDAAGRRECMAVRCLTGPSTIWTSPSCNWTQTRRGPCTTCLQYR